MARSSAPHVLKRWIALNLRELRAAAGKSRPEAAKRLGISRTAIGHLESARNLPSHPALEILLGYYGVPDRLENFKELLEAARKGKNWWAKLSDAVPDWFDLFLGLEAGAAEIRIFEGYLVPGILQISDYASAVMHADRNLSDEQRQQRLEVRMGRQRILERDTNGDDEPVQLWAVLDESVLYRHRGTPEVMGRQIEHLLEMSERPQITVQILPFAAGEHLAQQGSFQLLKFPAEFAGDPGIVFQEKLQDNDYREGAGEVAAHERAFTDAQVRAADPRDSRKIMQKALKEFRQ